MKLSHTGLAIAVALLLVPLQAADDPFAGLAHEAAARRTGGTAETAAMQGEFTRWRNQQLSAFERYVEEYQSAIADHRAVLISAWGEGETSDSSQWVSYSDDLSQRSLVDFEQGEIVLSIRHRPGEPVSAAQFEAQLTALFEARVDEVAASDPVLQAMADSSGLQDRAAQLAAQQGGSKDRVLGWLIKAGVQPEQLIRLAGREQSQVEFSAAKLRAGADLVRLQGEALKRETSRQLQAGLLEESSPQHEREINQRELKRHQAIDRLTSDALKRLAKDYQLAASQGAGRQSEITTVRIKLPASGISGKAEPYLADVQRQSVRFQLEQSLILGIMHTESHFNPMARSPVPAFGLMQIVPTTAGVDINRFLHNRNAPLTAGYLYQPTQNIEAGSAFLHLLMTRYLKAIDNPLSRQYCAIAAYNTGAGNVARAFNPDGSMNINQAAKVINRLSPEQVFQRLVTDLPYQETRNYMHKVTQQQKRYQRMIAGA